MAPLRFFTRYSRNLLVTDLLIFGKEKKTPNFIGNRFLKLISYSSFFLQKEKRKTVSKLIWFKQITPKSEQGIVYAYDIQVG